MARIPLFKTVYNAIVCTEHKPRGARRLSGPVGDDWIAFIWTETGSSIACETCRTMASREVGHREVGQ